MFDNFADFTYPVVNKPTEKKCLFKSCIVSECRYLDCKYIVTENIDIMIINKPSDENNPIHVFFRKDWKNYINTTGLKDAENLLKIKIKGCSEWGELSNILKTNPKQIAVHVDMIGINGVTVHEFLSMLEVLVKISIPENKKIPIAVIIEKTTPLSLIRELQKTNISGIIPASLSFGMQEGIMGLEAFTNGIPYWPKHILDQLPGAVKKSVIKNSIKLTDRQMQVVDLITERGLTNKKIAKALNITESTVKIHVSAILKAYGVRTRTQLVVMNQK